MHVKAPILLAVNSRTLHFSQILDNSDVKLPAYKNWSDAFLQAFLPKMKKAYDNT